MIEKLNAAQMAVYQAFQLLPIEQRYDLACDLKTACDRASRDWFSSPEYQAKRAAIAEKSQIAAVKKVALASRRAQWARDNLVPGMLIKMSGTRDRHGVRMVTEVHKDVVFCRQMSPTHRMGRTIEEMQASYPNKKWIKMGIRDEEGKFSIWEVTNSGTDHGTDKVAGVFTEDEHGCYQYKAIK